MNKREIITKVSERSGISWEECEKVLDAFEEVLSDELSSSKKISGAFDKVYKLMSFVKGKKDKNI